MPPTATDDTLAWSVCMSVCMSVCLSVTLVHPAKAVGWNEMPFGRGTYVVSGNTVLDRGLHGKGRFWDRNPLFSAMPTIAELTL